MNERLRSTLHANGLTEQKLAEELGVDSKTVQRWITQGRTPHRTTALRAARLLNVPVEWLWPDLEDRRSGVNPAEVVALYSKRCETPRQLWLDLILSAREHIDLFAYASLFLPEENPDALRIIRHKAENGVRVRIMMGDPTSTAAILRGREERLFEALTGRISMALAYYRPLVGATGVDFRLHQTALYNSIFRFDDQMLVNQHVYGTYGYLAPVLHLRRTGDDGGDLFATYLRSFELVWSEESYPLTDAEKEPHRSGRAPTP